MTIRRQISCRCLQMNCRVAADGSKWAYRAVDKLQRAIYTYISCRQIQRSCLDGSIGAVQMALELQCALEKQQMALEKLQRSCKLYYMSYIIEGSREEQQRALGGAVYVFILLQQLYMQRVSGLQRSCSGLQRAVDGSREAVEGSDEFELQRSCIGL